MPLIQFENLGAKLRNGVALRRATRAAVVVPPVLFVMLSVPYLQQAAVFGVFGVLSLLLFADFGGPLRDRFLAYVITTAVGVPLIVLGITVGQQPLRAALIMFVVAMIVGTAAVLRGMIAGAQTVLLLATVLSLTAASPGTQIPAMVTWTIGGLAAAVAALVLWPARPSLKLFRQLSTLYGEAATLMRTRWADPDPQAYEAALSQFDADLKALRASYDGNLLRPSGLTDTDRSIAQLVDLLTRLRGYHKWVDVVPADSPPAPELHAATEKFAAVVADELDRISRELVNPKGHSVDPDRIRLARNAHLDAVNAWVAAHRATWPGADVRRELDDLFPLRVASVSTELASASAEGDTNFYDATLESNLAATGEGPWRRFTRNLTWSSPWFRNALRAAIALSISVWLAKDLGLDHAFWIVLGTLTALRFDALGTGRTAVQALAGTAAGVLIGAGLIEVVGDNTTVWWILLPIALLITGYTPGNFSLAAGQAGFSVTVIVVFSLFAPATLATAELRLLDVTIGLVVSLTVSLLMWPRGVVATLHQRMTTAISAATDHLLMSIDYLVGGAVDEELLDEFGARSAIAMDQAREAYDLSIAQKPPQTVPIGRWFRVAIAARHVDVAARLLPGIARTVEARGGDRAIPLSLTGPMLAAAHDSRQHLRAVIAAWQDETEAQQTAELDPDAVQTGSMNEAATQCEEVTCLRASIDEWLQTPSQWTGTGADPIPALVTWTADWNAFIAWNADLLERTLKEPAPTTTS